MKIKTKVAPKPKKKRGRPSLGPRTMLRVYVHPDIAKTVTALARVRQESLNAIVARALRLYLRLHAEQGDPADVLLGPQSEPEEVLVPGGNEITMRAHEHAAKVVAEARKARKP